MSPKHWIFKYASQLKDLIDLQVKYTKHANNPAALNAVDYSMSVGGGLAIGRVAAVQQGNWIYPEVKEVDQKLADRLGMIPNSAQGRQRGKYSGWRADVLVRQQQIV